MTNLNFQGEQILVNSDTGSDGTRDIIWLGSYDFVCDGLGDENCFENSACRFAAFPKAV